MRTKDIPPFVTRMNVEGIMLNEISQTEKDKYCAISMICGILKKKRKKFIKNRVE